MKKYSSLTKSVEVGDEFVTPVPIAPSTPPPPKKEISFKQRSLSIFSAGQLPLANQAMTKSYNFSLGNALEYTCHRQTDDDRSVGFRFFRTPIFFCCKEDEIHFRKKLIILFGRMLHPCYKCLKFL